MTYKRDYGYQPGVGILNEKTFYILKTETEIVTLRPFNWILGKNVPTLKDNSQELTNSGQMPLLTSMML